MSDQEPVQSPDGPNAADQPRPQRVRVLKGARAAFNHEFSAIPCTVRDISETGAFVQFEGGWFVPDRFMLHVEIDGYKIECERVWQRGSECGVRFIGEKMVTGKARQQVITPDPPINDEAISRDVRALRSVHSELASPRPVQRPRTGGFGRRTR